MWRSDWKECRGFFPRLTRWLHRRGFRPATRFLIEKCRKMLEERIRQEVVSLAVATGQPVRGTVDEEGVLTILVGQLPPAGQDSGGG